MTPPSHRGRLLVATPSLLDPNFFRTVALLLEHSDEGGLGVVLNRPSETAVAEPLPEWAGRAVPPAAIFIGGPVARESVIAIAQGGPREPIEGWAPLPGDLATIDLGRAPETLPVDFAGLRVFVGYAGWASGQLDEELASGSWFVVDARPGDVHSPDPATLWTRVLGRQPGRLADYVAAPARPPSN